MTNFHLILKRMSKPKLARLKFDIERLKDPNVCEEGSICTAQKRFAVVFENNTATCSVHSTLVLGQPAGMSKVVHF